MGGREGGREGDVLNNLIRKIRQDKEGESEGGREGRRAIPTSKLAPITNGTHKYTNHKPEGRERRREGRWAYLRGTAEGLLYFAVLIRNIKGRPHYELDVKKRAC